ncbi:DUF3987 domain-containing protein [Desulfovibrio subterraneus]|uniref:DUF3987 domain-containing protein n=1 Tax=Desulfovibrio subterraneus TaxID=2718620 RepID=UPI0022B93802|nr:DUF3987 domain-containing protein [Desulfovibrio subterraneus]WBF66037.1 DUF3987 domain-containing protein [Desulfovibrio subterraneus]
MLSMPYASPEFLTISPYGALCNDAQVYANELALELGSSKEMVACTLLTMFAAGQIGSECIVSSNYRIGMSLFMAVGAEPSSGKTPIIKRMRCVLEELISKHIALAPDVVAERRARKDLLNSKIKGIKSARKKSSSTPIRVEDVHELAELQKELEGITVPLPPVMGKMSLQSFVKELSLRNGLGILIDDEGAALSSIHRVAPEDTTPLLDVWSNTSVEDITKHEQFHVSNPSMVMLGMWQSGPLMKFFRNQAFRENGLTARFLPYINPSDEPKPCLGQLTGVAERWYSKQLEGTVVRLKECLRLTGASPQFRLSSEAQSVLSRFREHLRLLQGQNMGFASYRGVAGKLDVQAVRLAMALYSMEAASFSNMEIGPEIMWRACCLALFFGVQSVNIVKAAEDEEMRKKAHPLIKTVVGLQLINQPGWGYTVSELCRPHGLNKKQCERLLFWMEAKGWISRRSFLRQLLSGKTEQVELWVPIDNFSILL